MNYTLGEINYINPPSHCWWLVLLVCDGTTGPGYEVFLLTRCFQPPLAPGGLKAGPEPLALCFSSSSIRPKLPQGKIFLSSAGKLRQDTQKSLSLLLGPKNLSKIIIWRSFLEWTQGEDAPSS